MIKTTYQFVVMATMLWTALLSPVLLGAGGASSAGGTREPISPIKPYTSPKPDVVKLGDALFHDPGLSGDGTVSCAHCHDLARAGTDRLPASLGVGGAQGATNSPTVFNSGLNFRQFWDGRAATLEEQAGGPIENPKEMKSSWKHVLGYLKGKAAYQEQFAAAFPDGINEKNVRFAIAEFERTLVTPNSKFDQFLAGKREALSPAAQQGYENFKNLGCVSCHQGQGVGGNMYQKFGLFGDYLGKRSVKNPGDLGRFQVTGKDEDKYVFKVPSLRNVAKTGPYFHDGSIADLEVAISIMGRFQLGRELSGVEIKTIKAFLESLTGEWRGKPI